MNHKSEAIARRNSRSPARYAGLSLLNRLLSFRHFELTCTTAIGRVREVVPDTLTSPTGAHRSVADIAFGWGFNSLARLCQVNRLARERGRG
jgi:hypothetical protein